MKNCEQPNRGVTASLLMALIIMLATGCAFANTTVCVPQDMTLGAALNQAQNTAMTIKIAQGSYDLKNTVWHNAESANNFNTIQIAPGSELFGGYNSNCATRTVAVGNTTITDSGTGANTQDGISTKGDLTISGLTFTIRNGIYISANSDFESGITGTILISRDAFVDSVGAGLYIVWYKWADGGEIRLVDTLIANNNEPNSSNPCALTLLMLSYGADVQVVNNTLVDNTGMLGACFYADSQDQSVFRAYNNIFFGDEGDDLFSDTQHVVLVDNIIGAYSGPAPTTEKNTTSNDPKLNSHYRPIQAPLSPAINSGSNSAPGGLPSVDLDGGERVVGSVVDRGAYESSVISTTRTVTNANDNGSGSLRDAIGHINSAGGGSIVFAIPGGCGPQVIELASELDITADVTIDGYSQNGASVNDIDPGDDAQLCVILESDSAQPAPATRGLVVPSTSDDSVSVTIKGLGFSGFSTAGVDLQGGSEHIVNGNHFGGNVGSHAMQPNGYDIRLGAGTFSDSIGGQDASDRNIIGDAANSGIAVFDGSNDNDILGNYIGLGWSTSGNNFINRGNGARGIYIASNGNTISGNVIGDNAQAGIVLDGGGAHHNIVDNNFIGAYTAFSFGNGNAGIHLTGDSSGTGDAPNHNTIRFNTIQANGAQGVLIDVGQGNWIQRNSIYNNAALGIDLDAVGVTDEDNPVQTADFANNGQNFPLIAAASGDRQRGVIAGTLKSAPGTYTVDFYISPVCGALGHGEGDVWLTSKTVSVPNPVPPADQGTGSFARVPIGAPSPAFQLFDGSSITATASDADGNTSEFSACVSYSDDGIFGDGFEEPPT